MYDTAHRRRGMTNGLACLQRDFLPLTRAARLTSSGQPMVRVVGQSREV